MGKRSASDMAVEKSVKLEELINLYGKASRTQQEDYISSGLMSNEEYATWYEGEGFKGQAYRIGQVADEAVKYPDWHATLGEDFRAMVAEHARLKEKKQAQEAAVKAYNGLDGSRYTRPEYSPGRRLSSAAIDAGKRLKVAATMSWTEEDARAFDHLDGRVGFEGSMFRTGTKARAARETAYISWMKERAEAKDAARLAFLDISEVKKAVAAGHAIERLMAQRVRANEMELSRQMEEVLLS